MVQQLYIQNYAIIDSLHIRFEHGLTIITGETGAGKSILAGALGLILGERADSAALHEKEKKCIVEGVFTSSEPPVRDFFKEHDLDYETSITIRREINPAGKSRAFINDTPVTLGQLKELSSMLVDLHQQFDTIALNDKDFQREVLDALVGNQKQLELYQALYKDLQKTLGEITGLRAAQETANKELHYNQFLFGELQAANFQPGELEHIEGEIRLMNHAENIKSALSEMVYQLEEGEQPVVQQLKIMANKLQAFGDIYPEMEALRERLYVLQVELKDIAGEAQAVNDKIGYNEERMNLLNERMASGYALLKKHQVQTTEQLLAIKERLEKELIGITNMADIISEKENKAKEIQYRAHTIAGELAAKRLKVIKPFEEKVNLLLAQVGMPNAKIKVSVKETDTLNAWGKNTIEFLFNANQSARNKQMEPLSKVASGGELSRLMLCIKSLVAKSLKLPTLIFDEIDAGISGEAARQVGIILKQLSEKHQVISITHQPQIAARADVHYFVYKQHKDGKIVTAVKKLDLEERVHEIAIMLSGNKPTAAAFENAKELIGNEC